MNSFVPNTPSTAIIAMMIACLLPIIFTWIAKLIGGFKWSDNENPREFLDSLSGLAARANAAEKNSYESLPMFLASVTIAILFFVPQIIINHLASLYVILRIAYGFSYLFNLALFRSILWILSMACIFMLFAITIRVI